MGTPLYIVDAFADEPFTGNPAAVCLLDEPRDDAWLQHVAAEMNLSETAFVRPVDGGFELRWFTPAAEVELCGHATLASAHLLYETGRADAAQPIAFHTRFRGTLTCRRAVDGSIAMRFPADPPSEADAPPGLIETLGLADPQVVAVMRSAYDWIVVADGEATVRAAMPDFAALSRFDARGIALTAQGDADDCDYVCRFFAPRLRINEDPVTGSLQCVLGPYWRDVTGRRELRARQLSARSGAMRVTVQDHGIILAGRAATVMRGELVL